MASQRKMRKLGEGSSNDVSDRNPNDEDIQKALEEADSYQNEIDVVNIRASRDILKMEREYNLLRNPICEKRDENLNKIPHFWLTTFANHPDLSTLLTDSEEECLQHLTKVEVIEQEDIVSGFKIIFHFEENPYFENRVLTKEFHLFPLDNCSSKSTPIKWKEGCDLMQAKLGQKRGTEERSFFGWFLDNNQPLSDTIADIIKDDIYQCPLQYFLVPDVSVGNRMDDEDGSDQEEEMEDQCNGIGPLNGDSDEDRIGEIENTVSEEAGSA